MSASFNGVISEPVTWLFKAQGLSYRESEVAELIGLAMTNKEIASELFIVEKTVKFHLTNIYKKVRVKSRAQLCVLVAKVKSGEPMIVPGEVSR